MRGTLEVEFDGKTHKISYSIDGGIITVRVASLSKPAQVGGSPPEIIARIVAKELLLEAKQKRLL
jgi:hypothetical protein